MLDYWQRQEISLFSKMSRVTVGPTQPAGAFSGINLQGHKVDHLPPSSAQVENGWSYIFVLSVCLHSKCERKLYLFICLLYWTLTGMLQSGPQCIFARCSKCVVCELKAVRNELWVLYWNNCRLDIHRNKFWPQE